MPDLLAQEMTVSGRLIHKVYGDPLAGVNVTILGTSMAGTTDPVGHYSLTVSDTAEILLFSSAGFQSKEVNINKQKVIDVSMIPDITQMNDLVITSLGIMEGMKRELSMEINEKKAGK